VSAVRKPRVGVLAIQGDYEAHAKALARAGAEAELVLWPKQLAALDALVLPGGESTTMSRLLETSGLWAPIGELIARGRPVLGTCAGMILLAGEVADGRPDQRSFAAVDIAVRRNGYGRQVDSFEADIDVVGMDEPFHAVFIRAPKVERVGRGVEVLATHQDVAVLVRQHAIMLASFHPEITGDTRVHRHFVQLIHATPCGVGQRS
jgi:5'-phosphate synthase pdxT subunit